MRKLKEVKIPWVVLFDVWSLLDDYEKDYKDLGDLINPFEEEYYEKLKEVKPQLQKYMDRRQEEKQQNIVCRWLSRIFQKK